jgi:hypothetical protein
LRGLLRSWTKYQGDSGQGNEILFSASGALQSIGQ